MDGEITREEGDEHDGQKTKNEVFFRIRQVVVGCEDVYGSAAHDTERENTAGEPVEERHTTILCERCPLTARLGGWCALAGMNFQGTAAALLFAGQLVRGEHRNRSIWG